MMIVILQTNLEETKERLLLLIYLMLLKEEETKERGEGMAHDGDNKEEELQTLLLLRIQSNEERSASTTTRTSSTRTANISIDEDEVRRRVSESERGSKSESKLVVSASNESGPTRRDDERGGETHVLSGWRGEGSRWLSRRGNELTRTIGGSRGGTPLVRSPAQTGARCRSRYRLSATVW